MVNKRVFLIIVNVMRQPGLEPGSPRVCFFSIKGDGLRKNLGSSYWQRDILTTILPAPAIIILRIVVL